MSKYVHPVSIGKEVENDVPHGFTVRATEYEHHHGLTIRQYFAAKALQGVLSDPNICGTVDELVGVSFRYADAMIQFDRENP